MLWVLGAFVVIVLLVLAGIIAFVVANRSSNAPSTVNPSPTISRTSSPPASTSRTPAPSRTRTRTATPSPSTSAPPSPGASVIISGIGENKTIACTDNNLTVSGISNTVVVTGHCTSLMVSGMQNTVTVDAADSIEASGFNNKVTYHTGTPKISNFGGSNVVQQG
jgi:hypothetical protein